MNTAGEGGRLNPSLFPLHFFSTLKPLLKSPEVLPNSGLFALYLLV